MKYFQIRSKTIHYTGGYMEKKKEFIQWVKDHRKELIIGTGSIISIIAIILAIKNKDALMNYWETLRKSIDKPSVKSITNVCKDTEKFIPKSSSTIEVISKSKIIKFPIDCNNRSVVDVSSHIRNLPNGFRASSEKIAMATKYGYELLPGQTWVATYTKGVDIG